MTTPTGIDNLIRRLENWRTARAKITARPERTGKPLPNDELTEAITYLGEYRMLLREMGLDATLDGKGT